MTFAGTGTGFGAGDTSTAFLTGVDFLYPKLFLGGVAIAPTDPCSRGRINIHPNVNLNSFTSWEIELHTLILFASRIISLSGSSIPMGSLKNVKLSIVNSFVLTVKYTALVHSLRNYIANNILLLQIVLTKFRDFSETSNFLALWCIVIYISHSFQARIATRSKY